RAVKDVNGNKTVFFNLGTTQLEAYDVPTATASCTIYEPGIDRPLVEVGSGGSAKFYHQDWLGSVVLLTDASGAKLQSFTYDAWGTPSGFDASGLSLPVSGFASRFLYTAREYDPEIGLYHYRTRAYSPTLGRFLQTDSIDFGGGDVNLFRYVANSSVNFCDPDGRIAFVLPALPAVGAALGDIAVTGLAALGLWELGETLANENESAEQAEECSAADSDDDDDQYDELEDFEDEYPLKDRRRRNEERRDKPKDPNQREERKNDLHDKKRRTGRGGADDGAGMGIYW
ncbi:MAG: RHS repeat-associated core domain-containing protein, partial [Terrimicrobiaceae bacterium]|nr:RHS repeat-associated core domain-containing protein [Terrimicrobiaceae bacterium]